MMKRSYTLALVLSFLLITAKGFAYDFQSGGIFYNILDNNSVAVTSGDTKYSGYVSIPQQVKYSGITYSVTCIGSEAFDSCVGLTSITIPKSVTSIGDWAFAWCFALTSITIPNSVTSIGRSAFSLCSGLTSITIPNSVTNIGRSAFSGCSGLTSIKVDSGNTTYDSRYACNAIIETATNTLISGCNNTIIPNSVTSIGSNAFYYCSGLTSITIPNTVTSIGGGAFYNCSGLTSITIPNSVMSIGTSAFYGCGCLTSITIPNSVTNIGTSAFEGSGLTSITIPNSVTSIGIGAFDGCRLLGSVISEIKDPFEINSVFTSYTYSTATLTVPAGTKSKYHNTNGWKEFKNIVEAESGINDKNGSWQMIGNDFDKSIPFTKIRVKNKRSNSISYCCIFFSTKPNDNTTSDTYYNINFYNLNIGDNYDQGLSNLYVSSCTDVGDGWYEYEFSTTVYFSHYQTNTPRNQVMAYIESTTQDDAVRIKANSYTREYGEENPDFAFSTSGGTLNGTPKITCSATKTSPVGTYTIKIEKGSVTNGSVTFENGSLTITKAPLTITANSYTRKQGESNPTFDVTYSGFKNGETSSVLSKKPTCSTTATTSSSPGTYPITVSGAEAKNYDINYVNGTLTVTKADAIVITATSYTREYGDTNPTFLYTTSGGSQNGTPKITCSATMTSPVGTYPIKIEQGSVTNSNVKYVDGTLTITKAPLTITGKSYTREEGKPNPTFEVTYRGFKNDETSYVLTKKPTCSTTATTSSPPGSYPITVSGAEAQNYSISYVNGTLTVTGSSPVSFASNSISYKCSPSTLNAEIQSIGNDLMKVEIPSSVTFDGKKYQVTSIADGVLSNRTFDYVSIPSSITSISNTTFNNSTLGALIWNANTSLPSSIFSNMAMSTQSNFLLYVNSKSYASSNVSNVVVGNSASSITLSDATNSRFYCPKEFTAQNITYTHYYSMTTGGNGMGWETIVLPFDVKRIEHKSKGVLTPFASYYDENTQRPFWLYEFGSSGFKRTDAIKANTPYIIAMPNSSNYDDYYNVAGEVTFSATNAKVPVSSSRVTATSGDRYFVPAFAVKDQSSTVYALNVSNDRVSYSGSYDKGSRFIPNLRPVYPFEAYMTTSSSSYAKPFIEIDFEDGTTGIDVIPMTSDKEGRVKVYSLNGQLIIDTDNYDLEEKLKHLPSGIYIVNGKKIIK